MSHRTKDLPPTSTIGRAVRELRYHEVSRQLLGVLLIFVFAATAEPTVRLVAIGAPLAVLGTLVRLWASGFITKNTELARTGPYALVRHPLYTGNILVVVGLGIANGHWWALPLAALFFWFYYPPAIEYEDRKLRGIFGAEWDGWAGSVPALVPRFRAAQGVTEG
ncbi:MAG: isoprenylcysteine carboxylmethyltransferase family protein, partial [Gammaproteobacteria bacterium]|nr:isoprenylcysteine carboxylmethyltransferase family protein [Gammaproteobacteria bacterium]